MRPIRERQVEMVRTLARREGILAVGVWCPDRDPWTSIDHGRMVIDGELTCDQIERCFAGAMAAHLFSPISGVEDAPPQRSRMTAGDLSMAIEDVGWGHVVVAYRRGDERAQKWLRRDIPALARRAAQR